MSSPISHPQNKPGKPDVTVVQGSSGSSLTRYSAGAPCPEKKERHQIQAEIKKKERAATEIVRRYARGALKEDDVRLCLYSIGDNNSFLNSNRKPITDCIALLQQYFARGEGDGSLAIDVGQDGARLSHSHEMQFNYVLQSLHLWASIIEDTFR